MKIDLYTKTVLTVIAISLSIIATNNIIKPADADNHIQRIAICDDKGQALMCSRVLKYNGVEQLMTYSPENARLSQKLYNDLKMRVNQISKQINLLISKSGRLLSV